jgi:cadmium resistance protein CadD (predicted permease)
VRHPALGPPIRRIARYALPVVLIGLGILILAEADTLSLIG